MPECDVLSDLGLPRRRLQIGRRVFNSDQDRALVVLLTATSWVLQRLPGQVVEHQRARLVRTLAASQHLVVEVECSPTLRVRVRKRLLVEIPAGG
jgi:hypothetical protein